ncbi:MAG TPA: acyl-CoA dehydrogenase, partial [Hyphomonas sp.]|nr:acyl-CoA dehydrogenase [Hyphomonas sp.]
HRRYRITEGSEEIQIRKVAGHLFGFMGPAKHGQRTGETGKDGKSTEPTDFAIR